jgi:hypothetical protein
MVPLLFFMSPQIFGCMLQILIEITFWEALKKCFRILIVRVLQFLKLAEISKMAEILILTLIVVSLKL